MLASVQRLRVRGTGTSVGWREVRMRCSRSTLWALRERRRPGGLHYHEYRVERDVRVGDLGEMYCFRMTYWFPVGVEVMRYVGLDWP